MNRRSDFLVLLGAGIGGVLGHVVFLALARRGLYGVALPGGLLGLGAGLFRARSKAVAVACGFLALGLGFVSEWCFAPFVADAGFVYFILHVYQLQPLTLIGFWVPFRRRPALDEYDA